MIITDKYSEITYNINEESVIKINDKLSYGILNESKKSIKDIFSKKEKSTKKTYIFFDTEYNLIYNFTEDIKQVSVNNVNNNNFEIAILKNDDTVENKFIVNAGFNTYYHYEEVKDFIELINEEVAIVKDREDFYRIYYLNERLFIGNKYKEISDITIDLEKYYRESRDNIEVIHNNKGRR